MESLTNKMRELAIRDLKTRREIIFEKTRNLFEMKQCPPEFPEEDPPETQNEHEEQEEQQEEQRGQSQGKMEVENSKRSKKEDSSHKKKTNNSQDKAKRYWRQMLQVNDRMVAVPHNLQDYYVCSRPQGNKCLLIFKHSTIELSDVSGCLVGSFSNPIHSLSGTVLEAYQQKQSGKIIIVDLIIWKAAPFASSEFEFRISWLLSNLSSSLPLISKHTKLDFSILAYHPCNAQGLATVYNNQPPYLRDGLLFVYKDGFYEPGLNPSSLVWKDQHTSPYFEQDCIANKEISKGVGYLNKRGEVVSLQNKVLFEVNRNELGKKVRFVKFTYQDIELFQEIEGNILVQLNGLSVLQTHRLLAGRVDSLAKLYYKSTLKHRRVTIEQLASHTQ